MKELIRKILMALMAVGFLIGLAILLYPLFSNIWNNYREQQLFDAYLAISSQPGEEGENFEEYWQAARDYNTDLRPIIIPDSFVQAEDPDFDDEEYLSCLNLNGDGRMGYIYIPKIEIRIPIYHTTDDSVLEKGAGHLHGSSLPVGGPGTHAILAAHRGLPGMSLFTDIDQLSKGDQFYLYILDDVLAYEVDQILTVEPHETDSLQVMDGQDYVTLVTCTPYGVNSHRLLVRGHRVAYEEKKMEEQQRQVVHSSNTNYILWVVIGIGITALILLIFRMILRRQQDRGRKHARKEKSQ